ncbi:hypothetical protein [Shewanella algae]|uniref:hypothetical protein n=1 Tax=Shewanella algae TaxID=38313 RepID=UPI000F424D2F|nr:hypothetical protein [Shewanella algae]AYV12970.1 hypothetical protein EEY24_08760 [Shewanella algae]MBO2678443.1 hypothetical protein [Shewanella algae]BCV29222.1 hypothetical protein TUM3811_30820 [Shewanella algae]
MKSIKHLLQNNQASLDQVAFKLRLAALLEANFETLRSELSAMTAENPALCLEMGAAIIKALDGLSHEFAGDRRNLVAFFMNKVLEEVASAKAGQIPV